MLQTKTKSNKSSLVTNGKIRSGVPNDAFKKNFDNIDWGARARDKENMNSSSNKGDTDGKEG